MDDGEFKSIEMIECIAQDVGRPPEPLCGIGDGVVRGLTSVDDDSRLDESRGGGHFLDLIGHAGHQDERSIDRALDRIEFDPKFLGENFGDFPIDGEIPVGEITKILGVIVCHIDVEWRLGVGDVVTHRRNRIVPLTEFFGEHGNVHHEALRFVPRIRKLIGQIVAQTHLGVKGVLDPHALDVEEKLVEFADLKDRRVKTIRIRIVGLFAG